jgi:hypothetical protein
MYPLDHITATVKVTEGGMVVWQGGKAIGGGPTGITSVSVEDGCVTALVGSGS